MKSALFVDFDNVFTQLRAVQPLAAERFARQPVEWMRWLTGRLEIPEGHDPAARRRVLVRRCYLNPNWYQQYRHAFLRAGFEIVDCPPVTSQGKTSTDIHMVLDIIELLQHETRYDEFIVLSADADFTPVLRKLRRYDRRTSVLAIGFPSSAYQASADLLIDERLFIDQALGLADVADGGAGGDLAQAGGGQQGALLPVAMTEHTTSHAFPHPTTHPTAPTLGTPQTVASLVPTLDADQLADIAQRIEAAVLQSSAPVPAGALALRLRQVYGQRLDTWNGHGLFKPFFRSLGLDRLVWLSGSGGRIADPDRHASGLVAVPDSDSTATAPEPPQADAIDTVPADLDLVTAHGLAHLAPGGGAATASGWAGHEALLPLAREVSALTGAPLLAPPVVRAVLDALCADLAEHHYEPTDTARRVCTACFTATPSIDVSLRDVVFILRGMQLNGHVFGRDADDVATLAERLLNQVLFLCQREQLPLSADNLALLRQWISGAPAA